MKFEKPALTIDQQVQRLLERGMEGTCSEGKIEGTGDGG